MSISNLFQFGKINTDELNADSFNIDTLNLNITALDVNNLTSNTLSTTDITTTSLSTNDINTTDITTTDLTTTDITATNLNVSSFEHLLKPEYDGIGFKVDGGIIKDNKLYRAIELIGRKNLIYTYETACYPEAGIGGAGVGVVNYRSPAGEKVALASTSANDTLAGTGCRMVWLLGIDVGFNVISEIINMNGQTKVLSVNNYYRVQVVAQTEGGTPTSYSGSANQGVIYAAAEATTFTGGIPNNRNNIIGVMAIGTGILDVCLVTIPPMVSVYFSEVIITSGVGNKNDNLFLNIKGIQGNSGWRNFGVFNVSSSQPTVSLHQGGFPNINLPVITGPLDLSLSIRREGGAGTTDNINMSVFMTLILVIPLP